MKLEEGYELVITIVNKGWSDKVIKVGRESGAQGATVMHARGSGQHDIISFLGITIEPEKELILNVVPANLSETIVAAISDAINLKSPGTGISMVLPLRYVTGLCKPSDKK